ncbi:MAG TPA: SRPBCC domain-containing protein [Streptosporangiaceae bacterium]|nr:SRPBCC domain-containing protein [Streptosporangiaceae bacterium]
MTMADPARSGAGDGDLIYTRVFDAPRALVFRCMIEPEHLTHFWGPAGVRTPRDGITVDPRPGGVFEATMVNDADGGRYTMRAIFSEVVEPERLVWTEPDRGVTTISTFRDLGGTRTEITICQRDVPPPFRSPQARAGFATSLDRFASYLGQLSGESS